MFAIDWLKCVEHAISSTAQDRRMFLLSSDNSSHTRLIKEQTCETICANSLMKGIK